MIKSTIDPGVVLLTAWVTEKQEIRRGELKRDHGQKDPMRDGRGLGGGYKLTAA